MPHAREVGHGRRGTRQPETGHVRKLGDPPPLLVLRKEPLNVVLPALLAQPAQLPLALLDGRLRLRRGFHVFCEDGGGEFRPEATWRMDISEWVNG